MGRTQSICRVLLRRGSGACAPEYRKLLGIRSLCKRIRGLASPDRMLVHTKQANQLLGESRRIVRDMDTRLTRTGNSAHSYLRCDDRHAITRRLEYLDALAAAGENGVDRHPRPAIE